MGPHDTGDPADSSTVDGVAAALPARVGQKQRARSDLAYTIATAILSCWTGK